MPIIKKFSGKNFMRPGVYSKLNVQTVTGSNLASEGTLLIIGTSDEGRGGIKDGIKSWESIDLTALVAYYGSGPLVEAAASAIKSPGPGIGGANRILTYKLNTHSRRESGKVSAGKFYSKKWGDTEVYTVDTYKDGDDDKIYIRIVNGDNKIQEGLEIKEAAVMTIINKDDTNPLNVAVADDAGKKSLIIVYTSSTGSVTKKYPLEDYSLDKLKKEIIKLLGDKVGVSIDESKSRVTSRILDKHEAADVDEIDGGVESEVELKANRQEIIEKLEEDSELVRYTPDVKYGLADAFDFSTAVVLDGGGKSTIATKKSLKAGLGEALVKDFALVTLAFSEDFADVGAETGLKMENAIEQLKEHLALRGNEKNGKEAQAIIGIRTDSLENDFAMISKIEDPSIQAVCQQVTKLDVTGGQKTFDPHILAALLCATRLGTPVGTPLTRKPIAALLVEHRITGEVDAFNPALKGEDAIRAGVTYIERRQARWVCALDNTTYVSDDSFVWNRGSVVEATYYTSRILRQDLEAFIGGKISSSTLEMAKSAIANRLEELGSPEVQILSSSDDAPGGYKTESLVVKIDGNTMTAAVEFKPVQGLDFVFLTLTISDISIS